MNTTEDGPKSSQAASSVMRVITRLNIGGPARQALLLTKELGPSWPTSLITGLSGPHEGELSDSAVVQHTVPLVRPVNPVKDSQAFVAIRRLLLLQRPAIIHSHMAKAGALSRMAARSVGFGPKVVHTYHGHVLEGYFGPAVQRAFLKIERALAERTDALIAISPEVKESLLELGIGRPEQYHTIPLGFDLSDHLSVHRSRGVLRSQLGLSPQAPLIGSIGRLVPIKDLSTLLKAMVRIPSAHLAVLGDGKSRAELGRLSRDLDLAHRVHFTGWYTDIPGAMSDLDLVVLSSLNEGTPVSLIEAGACGRAVVATDVGGVRYVVEHGRTGLLCVPGKPEALAVAMKRLLRDRELRRQMGAAGRERVRRLFHKDRLLSDIRNLYAELLNDAGTRRF